MLSSTPLDKAMSPSHDQLASSLRLQHLQAEWQQAQRRLVFVLVASVCACLLAVIVIMGFYVALVMQFAQSPSLVYWLWGLPLLGLLLLCVLALWIRHMLKTPWFYHSRRTLRLLQLLMTTTVVTRKQVLWLFATLLGLWWWKRRR